MLTNASGHKNLPIKGNTKLKNGNIYRHAQAFRLAPIGVNPFVCKTQSFIVCLYWLLFFKNLSLNVCKKFLVLGDKTNWKGINRIYIFQVFFSCSHHRVLFHCCLHQITSLQGGGQKSNKNNEDLF